MTRMPSNPSLRPLTAPSRAPLAAYSPLVKASIAWHGALAVGAAVEPAAWPWLLGGFAANHAGLTVAGLMPRSRLLGPNWSRLPADPARRPSIALTFDDGPDPELTPWVLEQLARHSQRATFFCIGDRVRQHPRLARDIVAAGHTIENHTATHGHQFAFRGPAGFAREVSHGQQRIFDAVGSWARFFRAPAGLRNPFLQPVLARLDLMLASWTRRGYDTVRRDPAGILARLTDGLAADDILLLHDGHAARGADGQAVLRQVLPALLTTLSDRGLSGIGLREVRP